MTMTTRKRHSPEQVVRKLATADRMLGEGKDVADVCRELGISEQTYYRWRNQFGGLKADDAKRLKELERENATLKRLLADAELEKAALKEIASDAPIEARRERHGDADVLGALGEQRDEWDRVALRREQAVLERGLHRSSVGILDHAGVLDEQVVEACSFQGRGEVDEQVALHPVAARAACPRIQRPGLNAEAATHEPAQMKYRHLR